jgi:putative ABC transport system permease protein
LKLLIRSLGRAWGGTVVAVMSLGLGLAGVTVVFSVVSALLLAPLPYAGADRLVLVEPHPLWEVYQAWQADNDVFDGMAGYNERAANLSGNGDPQRILMGRVTEHFLEVTGVRPIVGRSFLAGDFESGHEQVALITHRLWRRQYGGSSDVIGRTLSLDGRPYTIIGVLPPDFRPPTDLASGRELSIAWGAAVLMPLVGNPLARDPNATDRMWRGLAVVARLRPDVTLERAQSDLAVIAGGVPLRSPVLKHDYALIKLTDYVAGDLSRQLAILATAVGLLLIVACANVANLVLARGLSRRVELGTRMALGASRSDLVRQTIAETLALGVLGGTIGVGLAWAGARLVAVLGGAILSRLDQVAIDPRVLAFSAVVSIGTGVVVGILPALQLSNIDPALALRSLPGSEFRVRRRTLRSALVVVEVALSLVLLVGASLLASELARLVRVDLGFRTTDTLTADVSLSRAQYASPSALAAFFRDLLDRAAALPGVDSVALGSTVPAGPTVVTTSVTVDGATVPGAAEASNDPLASFSLYETVAGDYFETLSIPIKAGRTFDQRDRAGSPPVAIVSEAFAKKYWANSSSAIGRHVRAGSASLEIVGVAGDVGGAESISSPRPLLYVPYEQDPRPSSQATVFLHGRNAAALAGPLTTVVRSLNPDQPLFNVVTLEQVVFAPLTRLRLIVIMIATFGMLTILVAAAGVYGTTAYSVTERMHEMGIRLALGGSPARLFRLMVGDSVKVVLVGAAVGVPAAVAFTRFIASRLEGVGHADVSTYVTMVTLVALVGLVGSAVPALRATRADPREILRSR